MSAGVMKGAMMMPMMTKSRAASVRFNHFAVVEGRLAATLGGAFWVFFCCTQWLVGFDVADAHLEGMAVHGSSNRRFSSRRRRRCCPFLP